MMFEQLNEPFLRVKAVVRKLYIIGLLIFVVWYGFFLYPVIFDHGGFKEPQIPGFVQAKGPEMTHEEKAFIAFQKAQASMASTDLGYTVIEEQYIKGHFHHIGAPVDSDESNVCIRCHAAVPHEKAKSIRAFLNMHAFFIACETCHIQHKPNQPPWTFRWYDKHTGKAVSNPPGLVTTQKERYGNYGTKIAPGSPAADGSFRFINAEPEKAFVVDYLKKKDQLSSTEQSQMKRVIHRLVEEKPLLCDSCHTIQKEPYLPLAELGYPPRRLKEITGTEVVGLIQKYRDFFIPQFLAPGVGRSERAPEVPAAAAAAKPKT